MDYVEHLIVHRLDLILYDKVYGLFTNYDIRWGQGGSLAKVDKSWQGGSGGGLSKVLLSTDYTLCIRKFSSS